MIQIQPRKRNSRLIIPLLRPVMDLGRILVLRKRTINLGIFSSEKMAVAKIVLERTSRPLPVPFLNRMSFRSTTQFGGVITTVTIFSSRQKFRKLQSFGELENSRKLRHSVYWSLDEIVPIVQLFLFTGKY